MLSKKFLQFIHENELKKYVDFDIVNLAEILALVSYSTLARISACVPTGVSSNAIATASLANHIGFIPAPPSRAPRAPQPQ